MKHRTLHKKVCPCGQVFTTSDADSIYHDKKCSARYRSRRDGMPVFVKPSIEALKAFRRA